MLEGVLFLWFLLTGLSLAFVGIDIRSTPESPVLKWAFVLITAHTGPLAAFLYVLGCREPLPGLHERYSATPSATTDEAHAHRTENGRTPGASRAAIIAMPPPSSCSWRASR